jgi:putative ABC transport system permease protein
MKLFSDFYKKESIKYDSNVVSDVNMVPVSYEFIDIQGLGNLSRFYNESESNSGAKVIVLGNELLLFEDMDPIGRNVVYGQKLLLVC